MGGFNDDESLLFTFCKTSSILMNKIHGSFTVLTPEVFRTRSWVEASIDAYKNKWWYENAGFLAIILVVYYWKANTNPHRWKGVIEGHERVRHIMKQEFAVENALRRQAFNKNRNLTSKEQNKIINEISPDGKIKIDYNWLVCKQNETLMKNVE